MRVVNAQSQSPTEVCQKFRNRYSKDSRWKVQSNGTIRNRYSSFLETGHVKSQTKKGMKL